MEVDMQQLKRENYAEYRRIYRNEKLKNTPWYCDVCKNGKNYTSRDKFVHLKTKKHQKNYYQSIPLVVL